MQTPRKQNPGSLALRHSSTSSAKLLVKQSDLLPLEMKASCEPNMAIFLKTTDLTENGATFLLSSISGISTLRHQPKDLYSILNFVKQDSRVSYGFGHFIFISILIIVSGHCHSLCTSISSVFLFYSELESQSNKKSLRGV